MIHFDELPLIEQVLLYLSQYLTSLPEAIQHWPGISELAFVIHLYWATHGTLIVPNG